MPARVRLSLKFRALDFRHQTKIENHDAAFFCYQNVGRLDVSMELSGFMQAVETFGKLPHRKSQTTNIQLDSRERTGETSVIGFVRH